MTAPLAPCPGCGRADHARAWQSRSFAALVTVSCDCGWHAPSGGTDEAARAQWNRRAPALRWRSEPPDVPGWWWVQYRNCEPSIHRFYGADCAPSCTFPRKSHTRVAGPISEPEEGEK